MRSFEIGGMGKKKRERNKGRSGEFRNYLHAFRSRFSNFGTSLVFRHCMDSCISFRFRALEVP